MGPGLTPPESRGKKFENVHAAGDRDIMHSDTITCNKAEVSEAFYFICVSDLMT
jgi:hypothetical protein